MTVSKGIGRGGERPGAGRPKKTRHRLRKPIDKPAKVAPLISQASATIERMPPSSPPAKRAKQVLQEFMMVWAGMAAAHQPLPAGALPAPGQTPNEEKFLRYGELAADVAAVLIRFEEPALKAVLVSTPAGQGAPRQLEGTVTKLPLRDALGAQRLYRDLIHGDRKTG